MANDFQESLLKAIDTLANYRISQMDADKTVVATIIQCTNALTGEYLVKCEGGNMKAYAQGEATYSKDDTVYVLVPKGDYTQKKMILSTMSSGSSDNLTFVTSVTNDYNVLGGEVITKNGALPAGLNSYYKEDYLPLYMRSSDPTDGSPELIVNNEDLATYIGQATAVLIQADFRTALPREHRKTTTGNYGIQIICAFAGKDDPDAITYTPYVLDVTNMVGNPYQYNNFTTQQAMFAVDAERFLYVDSIIAFSNNFVSEDDMVSADQWGDDIFVDNIQIFGLQEIAAVSGDYMLKLSMPQGGIFKISGNQSPHDVTLSVVGRVTYKITQDLSQDTTFYWGKEDMEVDALSEYYNSYLGSGWRYMTERGNNSAMTTNAEENVAYENKWLCCAVYQEQVVLKQEFTLINQSAADAVKITSNLGTRFSFDRGEPVLTCLVNDKASDFDVENGYADSDFRFVWARVDATSGTIILDRSAEDIQKEIDAMLDKGNYSYKDYAALKNKLSQVQNVEFSGVGNNVMKYPVGNITTSATFKCSVYRKRIDDKAVEDNIGTAEITLINESAADASQYYILIENGDQVFQYSESGVSPASERYTDPLEIKQLICHFYDQTHLEVNQDMYDLVWKFPTSSTMLVQPTENVIPNESNDGAMEYYQGGPQRPYPLDIEDNYDYSALNNQITAIVTYDGQQFSQDTNFLFVKVGDNGTNGTDIVSKIVVSTNDGEIEDVTFITQEDQEKWGLQEALLCLEKRDKVIRWNAAQDWADCPTIDAVRLHMKLFRRNELIANTNTKWQIAGGNTHTLNLAIGSSTGVLSWGENEFVGAAYDNQIARGQITLEGQDYYCFYPVIFSEYSTGAPRVYLDKYKTLKFVTYNADGHNPLYNKNQGVFFAKMPQAFTAKFSVQGGVNNDASTSALKILANDNNADTSPTNQPITITGEAGDMPGVFVYPEDIYTGATSNHNVIVDLTFVDNTTAKFIVPICLSLNTFGLASLNAWDGQHVEINEDENYVLAPQVGAGAKDENNRFTGILMGTMETYDEKDPSIGLMGFSKGKQSIWLDAQTGNAIFGLPETQYSTGKKFEEGRIELIPGGMSKIGQWRIGSRALYNVTKPNDNANPDTEYETDDIDKPYGDYPVKGAQFSIGPQSQGMILNASPAYISVKGKPLNKDNCAIKWDSANVTIKQGDSLEVEIDPTKESVFSIYRHTNQITGRWERYPIVGINESGQFYTNAIKDGESTMGIGFVGAFGATAADQQYVGAQFAYGDGNLFKFYQQGTSTRGNSDLFFSTGSTNTNEYTRKMRFYAKEFEFWADNSANVTQSSNDYIKLTAGTNGTFDVVHKQSASTNESHIKVPKRGELSIQSYAGAIHLNATGSNNDIKLDGRDLIGNLTRDITVTANEDVSLKSTTGNILITIGNNSRSFKIAHGSNGNNVTLTKDQFFVGTTSNHLQVNVSDSNQTTASELVVNSPITLRSKQHNVNIQTNHAGGQIILATYKNATVSDANVSTRISMTSATDGTSMITMLAGGGANLNLKTFVASDGTALNGRVGVQIAPLLVAQSAAITGTSDLGNGAYSLTTSHGVYINKGNSPLALCVNGPIKQYCGPGDEGILHGQSNYSETYLNVGAIVGANSSGYGLWVKHGAKIDGWVDVEQNISTLQGNIYALNGSIEGYNLSASNQITVGSQTFYASNVKNWKDLYGTWGNSKPSDFASANNNYATTDDLANYLHKTNDTFYYGNSHAGFQNGNISYAIAFFNNQIAALWGQVEKS